MRSLPIELTFFLKDNKERKKKKKKNKINKKKKARVYPKDTEAKVVELTEANDIVLYIFLLSMYVHIYITPLTDENPKRNGDKVKVLYIRKIETILFGYDN